MKPNDNKEKTKKFVEKLWDNGYQFDWEKLGFKGLDTVLEQTNKSLYSPKGVLPEYYPQPTPHPLPDPWDTGYASNKSDNVYDKGYTKLKPMPTPKILEKECVASDSNKNKTIASLLMSKIADVIAEINNAMKPPSLIKKYGVPATFKHDVKDKPVINEVRVTGANLNIVEIAQEIIRQENKILFNVLSANANRFNTHEIDRMVDYTAIAKAFSSINIKDKTLKPTILCNRHLNAYHIYTSANWVYVDTCPVNTMIMLAGSAGKYHIDETINLVINNKGSYVVFEHLSVEVDPKEYIKIVMPRKQTRTIDGE